MYIYVELDIHVTNQIALFSETTIPVHYLLVNYTYDEVSERICLFQ